MIGFVGVIATQYAEVSSTAYQWGGRYVLLAGFLLTVGGVTSLSTIGPLASSDRRGPRGVDGRHHARTCPRSDTEPRHPVSWLAMSPLVPRPS